MSSMCGDHSCVFGPAKGMGTNGGCRCFDSLGLAESRRYRMKVGAMIQELKTLRMGADYVDHAVHVIRHAMTIASWLQRRVIEGNKIVAVEPVAFVRVVSQFTDWAKARPEAVEASKKWKERHDG